MEENLIGYLLDALEPDARREVEEYLREQPEARSRLELCRTALKPLECDRDTIEAPPGLWVRTLARIAEHRCQTLPPVPEPVILRARPMAPRTWWRRADVMVAAGVLLCLTLLVPSILHEVRSRSELVACKNNLREFYDSLRGYSDHHGGAFPNVAEVNSPRKAAGMVVPVLLQETQAPRRWNLSCPPQQAASAPCPPLDQLAAMNPDEFERYAAQMLGSYAYSLGHRVDNAYVSDRVGPDSTYHPLMSDRPPFAIEQGDLGNSPNHGGRGQNILFGDGRVDFSKVRTIGPMHDDIFLNERRRVAAGVNRDDTVLGAGSARPDW